MANTHSCTRRSGSPRTNRSSASIPARTPARRAGACARECRGARSPTLPEAEAGDNDDRTSHAATRPGSGTLTRGGLGSGEHRPTRWRCVVDRLEHAPTVRLSRTSSEFGVGDPEVPVPPSRPGRRRDHGADNVSRNGLPRHAAHVARQAELAHRPERFGLPPEQRAVEDDRRSRDRACSARSSLTRRARLPAALRFAHPARSRRGRHRPDRQGRRAAPPGSRPSPLGARPPHASRTRTARGRVEHSTPARTPGPRQAPPYVGAGDSCVTQSPDRRTRREDQAVQSCQVPVRRAPGSPGRTGDGHGRRGLPGARDRGLRRVNPRAPDYSAARRRCHRPVVRQPGLNACQPVGRRTMKESANQGLGRWTRKRQVVVHHSPRAKTPADRSMVTGS